MRRGTLSWSLHGEVYCNPCGRKKEKKKRKGCDKSKTFCNLDLNQNFAIESRDQGQIIWPLVLSPMPVLNCFYFSTSLAHICVTELCCKCSDLGMKSETTTNHYWLNKQNRQQPTIRSRGHTLSPCDMETETTRTRFHRRCYTRGERNHVTRSPKFLVFCRFPLLEVSGWPYLGHSKLCVATQEPGTGKWLFDMLSFHD